MRLEAFGDARDGVGFPLFVNLGNAPVLVIGGGTVATRRAGILREFGARVRVVSPELSPELSLLVDGGDVEWTPREYREGDVAGAVLVVAASSDREANREAGREARRLGVPVSVADRREECTFFFPAIVQNDVFTAGLTSNRGEPARVAAAAAAVRGILGKGDFSSGNDA